MNALWFVLCEMLNVSWAFQGVCVCVCVAESLTRTGGDGEAKPKGGFVLPSDDIEEVR